MSTIPGWKQYVVTQRFDTGCIPTGYETLLRASNVKGIDYETFQKDFDLGSNNNSFTAVAKGISERYPYVVFRIITFERGEGVKKLRFIENCLENKIMVLVSLSFEPFGKKGAYHIMPVVETSEETLTLVNFVITKGFIDLYTIDKNLFVNIHDNYDGGNDIAYLESAENVVE